VQREEDEMSENQAVARIEKLVGKRAFVAYRKANGKLSTRTVKFIKLMGSNVTVWCERREAMRTFKLGGFEKIVKLGANEIW
jgi:predicted DNA-binding transcriptional regulator YafY